MGVTIHFEGKLKDAAGYEQLLTRVLAIARFENWLTETIEPVVTTLLRVRDEQNWDYTGLVKGIVIYLHEDCDPIRLEFDQELYIQEFTKTQFAGMQYHLKVINLLRAIQPFFLELKVEDEGEFWETADLSTLREHLEKCRAMIDEEWSKDPSAQLKVKDPQGRIIDLLR